MPKGLHCYYTLVTSPQQRLLESKQHIPYLLCCFPTVLAPAGSSARKLLQQQPQQQQSQQLPCTDQPSDAEVPCWLATAAADRSGRQSSASGNSDDAMRNSNRAGNPTGRKLDQQAAGFGPLAGGLKARLLRRLAASSTRRSSNKDDDSMFANIHPCLNIDNDDPDCPDLSGTSEWERDRRKDDRDRDFRRWVRANRLGDVAGRSACGNFWWCGSRG